MAPVLAYWKIRGLAQPVRLLLNYKGVEFEDKLYEVGDAPDFSRDAWLNEKYSLGLDFPNLPYYIDGDVRISRTPAILRYLARKYDLDGTTEQEKIRVDLVAEELLDFQNQLTRGSREQRRTHVDMVAEELIDLRNQLVRPYSRKEFESLFPQYTKEVEAKIKLFSDFLGDRDWLAGEKITFVDFVMYELMDQFKIILPDCLNEFPKLQKYQDRFEALPAVKTYMNSDKFIKTPLSS